MKLKNKPLILPTLSMITAGFIAIGVIYLIINNFLIDLSTGRLGYAFYGGYAISMINTLIFITCLIFSFKYNTKLFDRPLKTLVSLFGFLTCSFLFCWTLYLSGFLMFSAFVENYLLKWTVLYVITGTFSFIGAFFLFYVILSWNRIIDKIIFFIGMTTDEKIGKTKIIT